MQPKLITYKGKARTISAWAQALGIADITLRNRLRSGWSVKAALTTPVDEKKNTKTSAPRKYSYDGKSMTLSEWEKHTGIPYYVLADRLRKLDKWSIGEALTAPNRSLKAKKRITYNGETLPVREWARRIGVPTNIIYSRMRRTDDLSRILIPKIEKPWGCRVHRVTYKGRSMSLYQWSKETGISRQVLTNRYLAGVRPPKLFEKPVATKLRLYTINGVTKCVNQWAKDNGIEARTVRARLKRGLTIEQALANVNYRCKEYRR